MVVAAILIVLHRYPEQTFYPLTHDYSTCNLALIRQPVKKMINKKLGVYSPGAGVGNPRGNTFYININLVLLWSFAVSLFSIK